MDYTIVKKQDEEAKAYLISSLKNKVAQELIERLSEEYLNQHFVLYAKKDEVEGILLYQKEDYAIVYMAYEATVVASLLLQKLKEEALHKGIAKLTCQLAEEALPILEKEEFVLIENKDGLVKAECFLQDEMLGKNVKVYIDHPYGSMHPIRENVYYPINCGYVLYDIDGDVIDAYVIGPQEPLEEFEGVVIGVVYRKDEHLSRLIVSSPLDRIDKEKIIQLIGFEEQHFDTKIVWALWN
ncbi:MAG: hypothetical protein IJ875_05480 [Solobacterium sp.]|nr:hypothetical protein [Solobacterium sp.]